MKKCKHCEQYIVKSDTTANGWEHLTLVMNCDNPEPKDKASQQTKAEETEAKEES